MSALETQESNSLSEITRDHLKCVDKGFLFLVTLNLGYLIDYNIWTFINLHLNFQESYGPHLMIGKKCGFKDYAREITGGGTVD